MRIIITIEERDKLLKLLGNSDSALKDKLLKAKRERKCSKYRKCQQKEKEIRSEIQKLIYGNYKIKNQEIIKKVGISKAIFYRKYSEEVKKLREKYQSQALF